MTKGVLFIIGGYLIWGLFPLYWKLLEHVSASEIVAHRILWSVPLLALAVAIIKPWRHHFLTACSNKKQLSYLTLSSLLIAINWGGHVYGVNKGWTVEVSMGYFLSPLISVLAGYMLFKERLSKIKIIAISLASLGVLYYIIKGGTFPWIGLVVGFSFAGYGIVRKLIDVEAIPGLLLEAILLTPIALLYILFLAFNHQAAFLNDTAMTNVWLVLSGLVTVIPLVLFTAGVRLVSMITTGVLLYITPTLQFLLGIWVFNEQVNPDQLIGFSCIWMGVILYSYSLIQSQN